jgi:hypothetical protein
MQNLDPYRGRQFDLHTILGMKISGSCKVNGILVPAASLQSCLHRFSSNLAVWTEDPKYNIQIPGSVTWMKYRGFNYVLCTKHQIEGLSFEKAGILLPSRGSYVSSAGYFHLSSSKQSNNDDNYDLIAFDFTDQAKKIADLNGRFFQLGADNVLGEKEDIVAHLAYGCPSADQQYQVDEGHVDLVSRSMTCDPVETPAASPCGECRLVSPEKFDMDGLSGGPVFASVASGGDVVVKLAGVINRAGNGTIHFIKAKVVRNLLDASFKNRAESEPI